MSGTKNAKEQHHCELCGKVQSAIPGNLQETRRFRKFRMRSFGIHTLNSYADDIIPQNQGDPTHCTIQRIPFMPLVAYNINMRSASNKLDGKWEAVPTDPNPQTSQFHLDTHPHFMEAQTHVQVFCVRRSQASVSNTQAPEGKPTEGAGVRARSWRDHMATEACD